MTEFVEIEQRIQALTARATRERPDARLLVEIEELLAEGYVQALRGDHYTRRLQSRFEALVDEAASGDQLRSLVAEQQTVRAATRRLRSQLAAMREHWVALGSDRLGLA